MNADLTPTEELEIKIKWKDGQNNSRQGVLTLTSGWSHGLLCISYGNQIIGFCDERGTVDGVQNRKSFHGIGRR